MKWGYFAMTKFFGKEPSEEGLKEVTDSMQALNDLRYKVIPVTNPANENE